MKRILYILILFSAALSYTACSSHILPEDEPVVETPQADGFTIYAADYVADWTVGSRSLIPLPDELQKQIHNLYYFFYDKEGYIERIYYQNLNPTMRVNVKFTDFLGGDDKQLSPSGVVYVIANSQKMDVSTDEKPVLVSTNEGSLGDVNDWKQNVSTTALFKRKALFPLFIEGSLEGVQSGNWKLGRPDHLIMVGMYDGTISDHSMQIPLGRIAVRMKFALSGDGLGNQARITISNAPLYTALYPEVPGGSMPAPTGQANDLYWGNFVETIDTGSSRDNVGDASGADGWYGGISNGAANIFYYCGENNYEYTGVKTVVKIETWDTASKANVGTETGGNPNRTYFLDLGNESPDIEAEHRDYSLYRNTSYTFNLKLNKTATKSASSSSAVEVPDEKGVINLYPL